MTEVNEHSEHVSTAEAAALNSPSSTTSDSVLQRYRTFLNLSDLFARQHRLSDLFRELAERLHSVASFDILIFALHDASQKLMRVTVIGNQQESRSLTVSVADSASGWSWGKQEPVIISDVLTEQDYPSTTKYLNELCMRSCCMLPLTSGHQHLGALGFAHAAPSGCQRSDLDYLRSLAEVVAMAVDNAVTRQALARDNQRLQLSLEISRILSSTLHFDRTFPLIADALRRVMPLDHVSISIPDEHKQGMRILVVSSQMKDVAAGDFVPAAHSLTWPALREREIKYYLRSDLERLPVVIKKTFLENGVERACICPLITSRGVIGTLNIAVRDEHCELKSEAELLQHVAHQVGFALENARALQQIAELKNKLAQEKLYLEDEIRTEFHFEEIIGDTPQMKRVLADARTVASSDANVLILGETGTGKELVARAIHRMSSRKDHSFIKLNCAAIPTGLLESELFGHEKGAFTGALTQKVGRLELAHGGSVFLDEVGDIPLELQPKLLRVLQDQEFERLGSTKTIKVNVRLIAATNRDLAALVAAREFRSDLYYRLRVFPILLPPLRDRREDIPMLVRYFVQRLSRRMNKMIDTIPTTTMEALVAWDWPGNVRELENFLERSVILSKGPALTIPAAELRPLTLPTTRRDTTLEGAEREHILRILRETGGVISGARGAAARLGLKRTTLQSKMQKLGISRMEYHN